MKNLSRKLFFNSAIVLFLALGFQSCEGESTETVTDQEDEVETVENLTEEEITLYMKSGDEISDEMQKVLLQNVSQAVEKGGTDYAVEFCNVQAMPLTDSISKQHGVEIQRVTDKNRNPLNGLSESVDLATWEKMNVDAQEYLEETEDGAVYYYKPIRMGMPTCIKCHGGPEDISESTLSIIQEKYPEDKALGYEMGDLRGMWKIKM